MSLFPRDSPVFPFLSAIFGSLQNVAPEKADELTRELQRLHVRLVVDQTEGQPFRAVLRNDQREVRCSVWGAEFLWASAYSYLAVYRQIRTMNGRELRFVECPDTALVPEILKFAFEERARPTPQRPWPSHLPVPKFLKAGESPDEITLATELWLCGIAWILHHEVAHVRLGHLEKFDEDLADEVAADEHATDWLLDGALDPRERLKRSLGIAIAVAALAGMALHANHRSLKAASRTHPPAGERILRALSHRALEDVHQAQELALVAVKVHLDRFNIEASAGPFEDASECLAQYCRALTDWELDRG